MIWNEWLHGKTRGYNRFKRSTRNEGILAVNRVDFWNRVLDNLPFQEARRLAGIRIWMISRESAKKKRQDDRIDRMGSG